MDRTSKNVNESDQNKVFAWLYYSNKLNQLGLGSIITINSFSKQLSYNFILNRLKKLL